MTKHFSDDPGVCYSPFIESSQEDVAHSGVFLSPFQMQNITEILYNINEG